MNISETIHSTSETAETNERRYQNRNFWVSFAGVISVVAYTTVAAIQSHTMIKTYHEIAKQTPSIKNTGDAAIQANRAWILPEYTAFGYFTDGRGISRVSARVDVGNTGPSPATNIAIWRCGQVRHSEPTVDQPLPGAWCIQDSFGMLGRGVPVQLNQADFTDIVPKGSIPEEMHSPGIHYYMWGKITYNIVPADFQHFTTFCFISAGKQLGPCQHGNDGN